MLHTHTHMLRMHTCMQDGLDLWDVAAAQLIVQEAGGVVLDFDGTPMEMLAFRGPPSGPGRYIRHAHRGKRLRMPCEGSTERLKSPCVHRQCMKMQTHVLRVLVHLTPTVHT